MSTETATAGASEAAGTTVLTTPSVEPAPAVETKPEAAAPAAEAPAAEAPAAEEEKTDGAPEEYAPFDLPEGFTAEGPVMDEFKATAKDLNLPQEAAQKVVALGAKLMEQTQQQMRDAWAATTAGWVDTIKADPEIGGAQMNERIAVAVKALDRFGSPELRKALNDTGMGNHPELVRAFYRAGLAISEDAHVVGKAGSSEAGAAAMFYPSMSKKD